MLSVPVNLHYIHCDWYVPTREVGYERVERREEREETWGCKNYAFHG